MIARHILNSALLGLLLLHLPVPGLAEVLIVNGDDAYAPVVYLKEGKPAGILPAILKRVEVITGDTYDIRLAPWKRAYETALRGEGGVMGVSSTPERAKLFDFSKPVYDDDIQLVTLKDKVFVFNDLEDLKGKLIGGVLGASYGDRVDQAITAGMVKMDRDVGQTGRLRKLLAGRIDAAFIGNGHAGFDLVVNSHEDLRANRDRFVVLPTAVNRDPLHLAFAVGLGKRAALARFDAAVEQLRKSGEFKTLVNAAAR
jgi:polar amino acid transport system substrate-binding protein